MFQNGMEDLTLGQYENKNARYARICIAQPRSGSTLLMRLMSIAGMSRVSGEYHTSYYEGLIKAHESHMKDKTFGRMEDLDKAGIFSDMNGGESMEQHHRMTCYYLKNLLCPGAFTKVTTIGFGNDLTEGFIAMIRDMQESDCKIDICFLTRDHGEILRSLQTTDGPGKEAAIKNPHMVLDMLEKQQASFKEFSELGDRWIKYDDLVSEPRKTLCRIGSYHYPRQEWVDKVMSRKIRG